MRENIQNIALAGYDVIPLAVDFDCEYNRDHFYWNHLIFNNSYDSSDYPH